MKYISDYLGLSSFGYSGQSEKLLEIIKLIDRETPKFADDIAKETGYNIEFVYLIQEILCSADLADYGISPRCCWLTPKGEEFAKKLPDMLKKENYEEVKNANEKDK